LSTAY